MLLGIEYHRQKKETGRKDCRWACKAFLAGHSEFQVTQEDSMITVTGGLGSPACAQNRRELFWVKVLLTATLGAAPFLPRALS